MAPVTRRGPDPLPRALVVVALVAVAALSLQARQGLDWAGLTEPLEVRWSRLVVALVLLVALAALVRRALRRLRRPRRPRAADAATEPEGEPFPWYLRVAAAALVLATVAAAFAVIRALGPVDMSRLRPGADDVGAGTAPPPGSPDAGSPTAVLLVVVGSLLLAAVAARWYARRRPDPTDPEVDEQRAHRRRLVAAVDAAEQQLARHDDPRQAVLAAYAAMARHLSSGIARRGGSVAGSDTAVELLDRSVAAGLVTRGPARTLTELFREARFSRHPMGEDSRRVAEACLAEVRDELLATRG